ncbi:MAG: hypothetical protein ACE5LB_08045 [Acidiferrobacterales bacterium]
MEVLVLLFAALIGVAALLASIAIWAPRGTPIRSAAVVITALFIPLVYLGLNELLSQPKPVRHEWFNRNVAEAILLGVSFDEGRAIYLWLRLGGSREPRYYVLPWKTKLAERLEQLMDESIENDATVKLVKPFSRRSLLNQGELNAEIIPPEIPPHKRPPAPAQTFNPREWSI